MADGYATGDRHTSSVNLHIAAGTGNRMGNLAPAARPVWDRDRRRHPPAIPSRRRAKYLSRPSLTSADTTARPRRNSCPPARLRHKRRAHQQLGAPRRDQALNPAPRPGATLGEASALRMIRRQQRPNDARGVRKGGLQHQGERPPPSSPIGRPHESSGLFVERSQLRRIRPRGQGGLMDA